MGWSRHYLFAIAGLLLMLSGCGGDSGSSPSGPPVQSPTALTYTEVAPAYTVGVPISANSPSSSGGAVNSYGVSPALPAGLLLNSSTGVISGTPTARSARANYNVTANNSAGSTTVTLTITVNEPPPASVPAVTLDPYVTTGKTGLVASTQDQGSDITYAWTLTGGTISAGQGTPTITYSAGEIGTLTATVAVTNSGGEKSGSATTTVVAAPDATLVIPASVHPGDDWMQASVPAQVGSTYSWSVLPGSSTATITSGQGTDTIGFSAGMLVGNFKVEVTVQNLAKDGSTAATTVTIATGTWVPAGNPAVARFSHTATLLRNGKVLVTGGRVPLPSGVTSSSELYDPATRTWAPTGSMGIERSAHTATLLPNGKVLVTGGHALSSILSSTELYDPDTGVWTPTGSMGSARSDHTATLLPDGKVLVVGGNGPSTLPPPPPERDPTTFLSSAEIFDPATGVWSATGGLVGPGRRDHAATLLDNGQVLVSGGRPYSFDDAWLTNSELYDPNAGTWASTGSLASPRELHTSTLLPDGKVHSVGGYGYTGPVTSSEVYDPSTGTWVTSGAMGTRRYMHTSTLLPNGKELVAGGSGESAGFPSLSNCELYDPATGAWTPTGSMGSARASHTATLLPNGKVLLVGGYGDQTSSSSAELYMP